MSDSVPIPHPIVSCPQCHRSQWVRPKYLGRVARCKRCSEIFRVARHVKIACPQCQRELRVKPIHFGHKVSCRYCTHRFRISEFLVFPCPSCRRPLRIKPKHVGRKIRCTHCDHLFRAWGSKRIESGKEPAAATLTPRSLAGENVLLRQRLQALEKEVGQVREGLENQRQQWEIERESLADVIDSSRCEASRLRLDLEQALARIERFQQEAQQRVEEWDRERKALIAQLQPPANP